jgi:hypothetical protein
MRKVHDVIEVVHFKRDEENGMRQCMDNLLLRYRKDDELGILTTVIQGFARILDVLPGRDLSSGNFTNGPSLTDMIELRPAGLVHSIHLIFSHFLARECLPRYKSPLPSSKHFASALLNSFLHSQKRQLRWKYCNNSPVFELPLDISPLPFVDAPLLPIDPAFPVFTLPFVRPPLLVFYQQ